MLDATNSLSPLPRPAVMPALQRRFAVAPMMDRTDRHCRYLFRLLSRRTLLYSEMVTTGAILFGDRDAHLAFDAAEHPLALQLGGGDPAHLAECAAIGESYGYDEINLNVGCPSDRTQEGGFGACLMADPALVARGVAAMARRVRLPVTVKCRIGIDDRDDYPNFRDFVDRLADAGCRTVIVHARKAMLSGLSPKENREIPPLRYDYVYRLKEERPDLEVILNGGIASLAAATGHLAAVDGVMVGRAAYQTPALLVAVDRDLFGDHAEPPELASVLESYVEYVRVRLTAGVRLQAMARHALNLFQGYPGARAWRRALSEQAPRRGAGAEVLVEAARFVHQPRAFVAA